MTLNEKANELKTSGCALTICGGAGAVFMILVLSGVIPLNLAGPFGIITKCIMSLLFVLFLVTGIISLKRSKSAFEDAKRETEKKNDIKKWFLDTYDAASLDEIIDSRPEEPDAAEEASEAEEDEEESSDYEAVPDDSSGADDTHDNAEASDNGEASDEEVPADDEYAVADPIAEFDKNYRFFARSELIKDKICERFMDVEDALMSELIEELYNEIFEEGDKSSIEEEEA
ncbi:MAG: hypothetical protein K6E90_03715 [Lachnospiraceae bacterium]|nr:hypothetical protein [Lachnospiraceae bacterium]